MLGHLPDERSYEMAKTVLEDLKIHCIKLLTNNPAKVSELAKLGIVISERVPLITKSNKYNRSYLAAKKAKFNHSFTDKANHYFYQFHADSSEQVEAIGEFLQNKINDPLMMICVGVTANRSLFKDKAQITRILSIYNTCNLYSRFVPVLHFSFRDSVDLFKDLSEIKANFPFVKRIQINDWPQLTAAHLKFASRYFSLDIPFSDENFDLIHDPEILNTIKHQKSFVLLDNSKGRGIQEPKASLMRKIEVLLNYKIKNIAIFGGFGPNDLQTFLELRRYYQLNFSIDAETKLK